MNLGLNSNLKKTNFFNPFLPQSKRKNSDPIASASKSSSTKSKQEMIGQFILGKTLGRGTFGKVKLGVHSITGEKAAIKILEKVKLLDEIDKARIDREIKILKSTFHHNIIRIYSVIETLNTIYLLTEYAEGGELFNYIVLKRKLNEYEACKYLHQLIDGIDYLHKMGICHRDLKPENMLLDHNKELKLADFGLSNLYKRGELLSTACGSPGYAAPEMIRGENYNGLISDIWSCGVILFVMVCGYLPFDDKNEDELYNKILIGKYHLPSGISSNVTDLISRILVTNPNKRSSISEIRNHPWYHLCNAPKIDGLFISIQHIPIDNYIIDQMKQYGFEKEEVKNMLLKNKHNNVTTLYYLLIKKNRKKGISSISDMISKQFQQFIKEKNRSTPECLLLTKVDSSIIQQESNKEIGKRTSNRNTHNMSNNNTYCTSNNQKEPESISSRLNNNKHEEEILINAIDFNHCATDLDDHDSCKKGDNQDRDRDRDRDKDKDKDKDKGVNSKNERTLENINEQNEFNNQFLQKCARIPRFKGLRSINNKIKNNEPALTKQLRTQYNKYVKNAWVKKKIGFKRGFLQTSMSFHKNEKQRNHNTFTIDNEFSTHQMNMNSRDNTNSNSISNNHYTKANENFYSNNPTGYRRRFQSQPKQRHISGFNFNAKINNSSTNNTINDKNNLSFKMGTAQKRKKIQMYIKNSKDIITLDRSFQFLKDNNSNNLNTSTNTPINDTSYNKKPLSGMRGDNNNSSLLNYKYISQKKRSAEHKAINLNIFATFRPSVKKHTHNQQHNHHQQHKSLITTHTNHLQKTSPFINIKPKNYSKAYRSISEPKNRDNSHKRDKYNTHSNTISLTHRDRNRNNNNHHHHQNNINKGTSININSATSIKPPINHPSSSTSSSHQTSQMIYTHQLREFNMTSSHKNSKKPNRGGSIEKYANLIKNIQNEKRFGYIGKPPSIKFGYTKAQNSKNKSNNTTSNPSVTSNKINNNFFQNKVIALKQKSEGEKSNKNRSRSTCSTNSNRELPIYNGSYDLNCTSSKSLSALTENVLRILPKKQISVQQTNLGNKYVCQKESIKFAVEFLQIKDQKNLIYINVSLIEGIESQFRSVRKLIQFALNNNN